MRRGLVIDAAGIRLDAHVQSERQGDCAQPSFEDPPHSRQCFACGTRARQIAPGAWRYHPDMAVDAIVIGGGPAGSAAALILAKCGWRVILCERGDEARKKACGCCLSPVAAQALIHLGVVPQIEALAPARTRRLRLHVGDGWSLEAPLSPDRPGWVVARDAFDLLLRNAAGRAGADIRHRTSARVETGGRTDASCVLLQRDGVEERYEVQLVVVAEGLAGRSAHAVGLAEEALRGGAYGFSFDVAAAEPAAPCDDAIEMFLGRYGYLGVVRAGSDLHVAGLVRSAAEVRRGPFDFLAAMRQRCGRLAQVFLTELTREQVRCFAAAGPMPYLPRRRANRLAVLVGDAAGYIEPFTGEGMTWALQCGVILDEVLANARRGEWTTAHAAAYERLWRERIGRELHRCRRLCLLLRRPALLTLLAQTVLRPQALRTALVRRVNSA